MVEDVRPVQFKTKYAIIKTEAGPIKSINNFLTDLLSNTDLEGIIVPQELPGGRGFVPALITEPESLATANAIAPVMPVNAARAVSDLTRLSPVQGQNQNQKTVAAVLRPCESRALLELAKLKQANLDNLIIIGVDCPGTVPVQVFYASNNDGKSKNDGTLKSSSLIQSFKTLKDHTELRSACQACEFFVPGVTDITIGLFGLDPDKNLSVSINSEKAETMISQLGLKLNAEPGKQEQARDLAIEKLKENRLTFTQKLEAECQKRISGLDNFMSELKSCINCHNCMTVCPICYCKECYFESPTFDIEPDKYLKLAEQKGSLRIPSNMFLFHVTRFNHMVLSCVACGMCEQGCPVNIPLLSIYKTVGRKAQQVFDYEPGRLLEEEIPILTFQEDELEPK